MLDEIQENLVEKREPAWGKAALTVKGNFSWGLINKQEDEESEDEDSSAPPCAKLISCCTQKKNKIDEDENESKKKDTEEEEKNKLTTVGSKMNLKNLDLEIKSGEFVCIVGDVGSGKTSLLNAIIGDMMFVSDE